MEAAAKEMSLQRFRLLISPTEEEVGGHHAIESRNGVIIEAGSQFQYGAQRFMFDLLPHLSAIYGPDLAAGSGYVSHPVSVLVTAFNKDGTAISSAQQIHKRNAEGPLLSPITLKKHEVPDFFSGGYTSSAIAAMPAAFSLPEAVDGRTPELQTFPGDESVTFKFTVLAPCNPDPEAQEGVSTLLRTFNGTDEVKVHVMMQRELGTYDGSNEQTAPIRHFTIAGTAQPLDGDVLVPASGLAMPNDRKAFRITATLNAMGNDKTGKSLRGAIQNLKPEEASRLCGIINREKSANCT